jgi:hypothetical protein
MEKESINSANYTTQFRILCSQLAKWFSIDPIVNYKQSPFCAMDNNPIIYTDRLGAESQSTHIDKNGKVIAVILDKDNGIYQHSMNADGKTPTKYQIQKRHEKWGNAARGKKVGETEFEDEFLVPKRDNSTGTEIKANTTIKLETSWEPLVEWGNNRANRYDLSIVAQKSKSGQELDIKTNKSWAPDKYGAEMTGRLLNGKYVTARSAGNYLAGMNGATGTFQGYHISKETYIKLAGALEVGAYSTWNAMRIVTFGISFGKSPYYGEMEYSGRMILKGFDVGVSKR